MIGAGRRFSLEVSSKLFPLESGKADNYPKFFPPKPIQSEALRQHLDKAFAHYELLIPHSHDE